MMKAYKTYQEAKIAHPNSDIYVSIGGKFAPDFYVSNIALCGIKEGWNKYNPQTNEFNTYSIAVTNQEEEEFNAMANNSEVPNGSDWKGGDVGEVNGEKLLVISYHPLHPSIVVVETNDNEYLSVGVDMLKKPETPQQRENRERLEASYDLYCLRCDAIEWKSKYSFDEFQKEEDAVNGWLSVVDKTNYRVTK